MPRPRRRKMMNGLDAMIDGVFDFDSTGLRDYFYRANYAVFLNSIVGRLPQELKDESEYLWSEYSDKFPIASTHIYEAVVKTGEDEDGYDTHGEPFECTVFPVSLLYSMPEDWQTRLIRVLDAMNEIECDDHRYVCRLRDPFRPKDKRFIDDPYSDRWSSWNTDSQEAIEDSWYRYGK
jgi:hypothetical protein